MKSKCIFTLVGALFVIAALLDLKYKGLGYRLMADSVSGRKNIDS
ncbi:hypothetical protein [Thalassobacillus pellis]|nr:hypothetical protein [Thalassobacillus pellis]MBM7552151.1 hypothetical protein [Thalassobacillus pellis]